MRHDLVLTFQVFVNKGKPCTSMVPSSTVVMVEAASVS